MAPLPTIAGVYRVVLEWHGPVSVIPVNVFHVYSPTDAASDVAGTIADALVGNSPDMWDPLYSGLGCDSILVTPLDGSSAGFPFALSETIGGGGSGGLIPSACAVVSLHTEQRGSRGRGRMYVGPIGETQFADGILAPASQANMVTGWGGFFNDMNEAETSVALCVASYTHADMHIASTIRIDTVTGVQRRRNNQIR